MQIYPQSVIILTELQSFFCLYSPSAGKGCNRNCVFSVFLNIFFVFLRING